MTAYIRAADAIREAFECAVIVVHHCGVEGTRPRGHTSLTGAADAQLAVKRDSTGRVIVTVDWMKDGPEGDTVASQLEQVEVGTDEGGQAITSCIVVPADVPKASEGTPSLTKNQQTIFQILHSAGERGLTLDQWNDKARAAGIGLKRRADIHDCREALKAKGLVYEHLNAWAVKQ